MICKDCEQDVNKLTRNGVCHQCMIRFNNTKYLNKRNGTNKPYIPLKDLKGTVEYNRVMGRRHSAEQKNKPKTRKTKTTIIKTEPITNDRTNQIKDLIQKDLDKYYKDFNINPKDNFLNLEIMFEWFYGLCQKNNYMDDLLTRRKIYDTLVVNSLHELKNPQNTPDFFAIMGEKLALIQEQRTPIDSEYDKYKTLNPMFDFLREHEDFLEILQECRTKLLKLVELQQDPKYVTTAPSMEDYDFTIKPADDTSTLKRLNTAEFQGKFYFKIKRVKYLYGNPNYQEFIYSGYIISTSEKEAKNKFIAYIRRDFPNLVFNTKDIEISTIPFNTKECS